MNTLKKIVEFIRSKLGTAMERNISIEDRYTEAANTIIDKITELRNKNVLSINEEKRLRDMAADKDRLADSREREIKRILREGGDVTTHAKLGLLYRRTAEALRMKADEYVEMRAQIRQTVIELDDKRMDLKVKLEYIRETRSANALGISTAEDVVEIAKLTEIKIDDTLMKVETFHSADPGTETTQADVEEYINSLK